YTGPLHHRPGVPCLSPEMRVNSDRSPLQKRANSTAALKRMEPMAIGTEERLRLALSAGRMGMWELDPAGPPRVAIFPELEAILCFNPGGFDGRTRTLVERIHAADRRKVRTLVARALQKGSDLEFQVRFLRPERSMGWLLGRGVVHHEQDGRP